MADKQSTLSKVSQQLPRVEITTVRLNVLVGIFLIGEIVVRGHAGGLPETVLTGVITMGGMLLKDIVQADNRKSDGPDAPPQLPGPST